MFLFIDYSILEHRPDPIVVNVCLSLFGIFSFLFLIRWYLRKSVAEADPLELGHISTGDLVIAEYSRLLDKIEKVKSTAELDFLESETYDFEEKRKRHAWTDGMFKDLLTSIQEQHNLLSARRIQEKVSHGKI